MSFPAAPHSGRIPVSTSLFISLGVVGAGLGLAAVGAVLHLQPLHAGFLLLWFWTAGSDSGLDDVEMAMLGACGGAANGLLLQSALNMGNVPLVIGAVLVMLAALVMMIARRVPALFNPVYMMFLIVLSPPLLRPSGDFRCTIGAVLFGVLWFGASALLARRMSRGGPVEKAPRPGPPTCPWAELQCNTRPCASLSSMKVPPAPPSLAKA